LNTCCVVISMPIWILVVEILRQGCTFWMDTVKFWRDTIKCKPSNAHGKHWLSLFLDPFIGGGPFRKHPWAWQRFPKPQNLWKLMRMARPRVKSQSFWGCGCLLASFDCIFQLLPLLFVFARNAAIVKNNVLRAAIKTTPNTLSSSAAETLHARTATTIAEFRKTTTPTVTLGIIVILFEHLVQNQLGAVQILFSIWLTKQTHLVECRLLAVAVWIAISSMCW